ncbi:MAG: glycoside hydrolase [Oscillospiraceae bacterium]|jgi:hypothetical protein|nr:glycoside hydrolase [Oscillospiraceae bacterium]
MQKIGKIVYEMPPGPGNPRNSEGAFIDLADGRILFAYSHYYEDSASDGAPAGIARCYSSDAGETWTEREIFIRPEEHGAQNVMSVSLLRLNSGEIGLFYIIKRGDEDECRLHLRRSSDEGETWGTAVCCVTTPGYFVTNNDRVIRLASGRLVVAAAKHTIQYTNGMKKKQFDDKGIVYFYLSDDDGYTWHEARNFCALGVSNTESGLQEPGVLQLKSGVLWAWARTDLGRQYQMFSLDEGERWTHPEPSAFSGPCSPLSIKRNLQSGDLLAIWNPVPMYQTRKSFAAGWGRTPLVGAVSRDEGETWDHYFYVDNDEKAGYCYTAIHFTDDAVLLAYCAGSSDDGTSCLVRQRIKKIQISDIMNEHDPLDGKDYHRKK